jgi:hypothetical protein
VYFSETFKKVSSKNLSAKQNKKMQAIVFFYFVSGCAWVATLGLFFDDR